MTQKCPACKSPVKGAHEPLPNADPRWKPAQKGEVDGTMLANSDDIGAVRADRAARRAKGNLTEELAARTLADDYRSRAAASAEGEPEKGIDDCPACGATDVKVDEKQLSPTGVATLTRKRAHKVQQTIAASADQTASRLRKRWQK